MYLWVDGIQQTETASNSVTLNGTQDLGIGANSNGSNFLDGKMGITRIFSRALSEAEIKALYMIPSGVYGEKIHGVRIADGTITADAIYTDTLAAITANIGAITNGSLTSDATYNFWDLSTGEFRIGDADNYLYFDAAGSTLTMKMDAIYVSTLETRVKGELHVGDAGDIETGLTNPVEIYTESSGSNAVIEHPSQIDLRINSTDILTVDSTGVGIGGTPNELLEVIGSNNPYIRLTDQYAPGGSGHLLGGIKIYGQNDASSEVEYVRIDPRINDASSGSEVGQISIQLQAGNGTLDAVANFIGSGKIIVGPDIQSVTSDGTLHVHTGSAGSVTAHANADDLVVEHSNTGGISVLVPDNAWGAYYIGSPSATDARGAIFQWNYDNALMQIGTIEPGNEVSILSGDWNEAIRIDSSQNTQLMGGLSFDSGTTNLKCKVIEIGDWNMDSTTSVTVAHGLTLANIRSVSAIIRDDADAMYSDLSSALDFSSSQGASQHVRADSTNIRLERDSGGYFDSSLYDKTSYNRGWIVIWYEV
jgi:hypothetical protein